MSRSGPRSRFNTGPGPGPRFAGPGPEVRDQGPQKGAGPWTVYYGFRTLYDLQPDMPTHTRP